MYKNWLKKFLIALMVLFLFVEFFYRFSKPLRHEIDFRIDYISRLKDCNFKTVILGDSLGWQALDGLTLKKDILNLTSNAEISLAGNYFFLKRYLEKNSPPKNVYILFTPGLFMANLNSKRIYSNFTTVFNKKNEILELIEIGRMDVYLKISVEQFFQHRKSALQLKSWREWKRETPEEENINLESTIDIKTLEGINELSKWDFNYVNDIPKVFIVKIINLCRENNINLTLVLEPLPFKIYQKWNDSNLRKHVKELCKINDINFFDMNSYAKYYDSAFVKDGAHLKKNWNDFYLFSLNKNVVKVLD